jgi:hypothetical protein
MDVAQLKNKAYAAVFWNLSGTLLKQGITFVISIFVPDICLVSIYITMFI